MTNIIDLLKEKIVIFDGAMGTSIQNKLLSEKDLPNIECNEYLNIVKPNIIKDIHSDFLKAGADVIETNTFGALPYLLTEFSLEDNAELLNSAGVRLALEIARDFSDSSKPRFVSGSMGPGTKLPSLLQISYDDLYKNYYLQAECFISEGVHLIQIETGQDPLQMKIALKATLDVKKALKKDIPIFLQATIQDNGQMLVGTDLLTFIQTFRDMPISGMGINCGTGPHKIEHFVKTLTENCPLFISVLPNAGLPILQDGKLVYDLTPEQFGATCKDLVDKYRINAIGGCCGTTYEFIGELDRQIAGSMIEIPPPTLPINVGGDSPHIYGGGRGGNFSISNKTNLTSLFTSQEIKTAPAPLIIGERANVNGSKKFKKLLEDNDWEAMLEVCVAQQDAGSHALDICLIHLDRDEVKDMKSFIPLLNKTLSVPLMIDSMSFHALETALKYISGKAIVNSVNFEHGDEKVVQYIEMCRDMNAALICLTIDEEGMARTKEEKIRIVERFLALCERHFYPQNHVFIDCLTFALSTGEGEYRDAGKESIETIKYLTETYPEINTIMGVSNVSYGLNPNTRQILNSVFLSECVQNGLTAAIVDSSKILPINDISDVKIKLCHDLIYDNISVEDFLLHFTDFEETQATKGVSEQLSPKEQLYQAILKGRSANIQENILELSKTTPALDIINHTLIPAMQEVGALFERGKLQLPFVLKSAETMKKSVDFLEIGVEIREQMKPLSIILATVKGDVHDIGKNLVQIIVENNGYKVYDIGVKKGAEEIYQAIVKYNPSCLGLSALLIKSTEYMKETLEYLKAQGISIPVICGGAALNKDFVENVLQKVYEGKVVYGKDAFAGLKFMREIES